MKRILVILALISLAYLCSCGVSLKAGRHCMLVCNKQVSNVETGDIAWDYRITDGKRFIIFRSSENFYFGDSLYIRRRY